MPDYFEDGLLNERGAWHSMGDVWNREENGPLYASIAMKHKSMDWNVYKEPIIRKGVPVAKKFFTVRDSDDTVLGIVGSQYEVIQNVDGFHYLDQLVDDGEIEIETAISLKEGRVISILARKPGSIKIADDDHDRFIGFTNRHDGLGTCRVFTCWERVVCANTLAVAQSEFMKSGRFYSIRHSGNTQLKLQEAREALELSFQYDEELATLLNTMSTQKLDNTFYKNTMADIVGLRQIDRTKQERKYRNAKETAFRIDQIRRTKPDLDNIKNTRLGLLNAVTDYETHGKKFRNEGTKFQTLAVDGGALSNKAFALLAV